MQGITSSQANQTMTLLVQNLTKDDVYHNIEDVDTDITLEDLKCLLEIESMIPVADQVVFYKQTELKDDFKKLVEYGVSNNDMLTLTKVQGLINQANSNLGQSDQDLLSGFFTDLKKDIDRIPKVNFNQMFNQLFHNQRNEQVKREAAKIKELWANDQHMRTQWKNSDPELAGALDKGDNNLIEKIVGGRLKEHFDKQKTDQERLAKLRNADPNDKEAQKEIEEMIKKEMIQNNYAQAQEQFPEFFGHINMLYVDVKVNKKPVQAFVDSGAQSTIISQDCARECGIMNLLDTRFAGMAVGVGSSRILGRIHIAEMEIGGQILQCSFTVLEDNKVDLLFGLDNLKRHQCCIDLVTSKLHIRNWEFSVDFLGDGDIKKKTLENEKQFAAGDSKVDEKVVKELEEMGFQTASIKEALTVCDGDKANALNYLSENKN